MKIFIILFIVLWMLMGLWGWRLHSYQEQYADSILLALGFILLSPIIAIIEIITMAFFLDDGGG